MGIILRDGAQVFNTFLGTVIETDVPFRKGETNLNRWKLDQEYKTIKMCVTFILASLRGKAASNMF